MKNLCRSSAKELLLMIYRVYETREALEDISRMAQYMSQKLQNPKAAQDFINQYDTEIKRISYHSMVYKGICLQYRTYKIRMKSFKTYHIFYIVKEKNIIVLRVLKDRQNWQYIMKNQNEYHW